MIEVHLSQRLKKKTELIHIVIANGANGSLIEMEIEQRDNAEQIQMVIASLKGEIFVWIYKNFLNVDGLWYFH